MAMIEGKIINGIYVSHGLDPLKQSWVVPTSEWLNIVERNAPLHKKAASEVLNLIDPSLARYWEIISNPLLTVFLDQLKNPRSKFKSWNVNLPVLEDDAGTKSIADLAKAQNMQQALDAIKRNNDVVEQRYKEGKWSILAVDGEVWTDVVGVELSVVIPDMKNIVSRKLADSMICAWINEKYHRTDSSNNMLLLWGAGDGWDFVSANSINMGHQRTAIFTNLFKSISIAKGYCERFGWKYPGDERMKEIMINLYTAHERGHEIRIMFPLVNELSPDLIALTCVLDLAQKNPFGPINPNDLVLGILAEYGAQAKEKPVGHQMVDGYALSGTVVMKLMLDSEIINLVDGKLAINMANLPKFLERLLQHEWILAQGGGGPDIVNYLPIGALPQQLLDML